MNSRKIACEIPDERTYVSPTCLLIAYGVYGRVGPSSWKGGSTSPYDDDDPA